MIFFLGIADFLYVLQEERKQLAASIVDRIDGKAAETGTSRPKLAAKAGIAKNSFVSWKARGTIPAVDIALVIADELQCSVRWLVTGVNDKQEEYSLEERNLVSKFRQLDKQGQFELKALLEAKTIPVGAETLSEVLSDVEKKRAAG